MRAAVEERRLVERRLHAAKLVEENQGIKRRLAEACTRGRDDKGLSAETEAMRAFVEERRLTEKQKLAGPYLSTDCLLTVHPPPVHPCRCRRPRPACCHLAPHLSTSVLLTVHLYTCTPVHPYTTVSAAAAAHPDGCRP